MEAHQNGLEGRVRRLERTNRFLVALVGGLVLLPMLAGARQEQVVDELKARRIQVVDDAGRVRIDLHHDSTETGMFIIDAEGDTRLGAAQFSHGGGGYALHGPGGRGAAVLYLSGAGSLTLFDAEGGVTARFPEAGR